ncbi:MAG: glycoside hydrolase family 9 protein [Paracoccaceae bacterium]
MGTAALPCLLGGGWDGAFVSAAHAQPMSGLSVSVGRAGTNCLQLLIEDRRLTSPAPVEVPPDAETLWTPKPDTRFGGAGQLNGVVGNFSGLRHTSAPQLFTPWPRATRRPHALFDPLRKRGDGSLPADDPLIWQVEVDGMSLPVAHIYRKSLPIRTARMSPRALAHEQRHLISLILPLPLKEGAHVRIRAPRLDIPAQTLKPQTPCEAVHVCHAGYALQGPKKAYVGLWFGTDREGAAGNTDPYLSDETLWRLVSETTGQPVAHGHLERVKSGEEPHFDDVNFNGCDIYEADFSAVVAEGSYRIEIERLGASVPFPIEKDPYAEALRLSARWYFNQRSGCAISSTHGEGRSRPRNGHPEDGLEVWQSDVRLGRTSEGFSRDPEASEELRKTSRTVTNPDAWGGWHDAGDWDRRIQHMDAIYTMAKIIELFPSSRDLHLNIPESGKVFSDPAIKARKDGSDRGDGKTVLPDLIHEALWGLSLWRRTQGADGSIIGGVEYSMDGIEGSVSWNPVQRAYAYAAEEWAAYRFTTAAAALGHVIYRFCGDRTLGRALISEAEAAWDWAEEQVRAGSADDSDRALTRVTRARIRAAGPLYRAAGHGGARSVFEAHNPFRPQSEAGSLGTRPGNFPYPALDYAFAGNEGRPIHTEIADVIRNWTATKLKHAQRIGRDYGLHNTAQYGWGLGWFRFGPGSNWRAGEAGLTWMTSRKSSAALRDLVVEGLWFALGCNPSNTSFIQGLGQRDFSDPLALDLRGYGPVPGQISFGVAGGRMRPFERRKLKGSIHPADQMDWPRYAQIFESSRAVLCAEHGMKSNAMEWLFACAMAAEMLKQSPED